MLKVSATPTKRLRSARHRLGLALVLAVSALGCAPATGWQFADDPGIPVSISIHNQGSSSASLVAYEDGAFILERAYERGEDVEVRRLDGEDYVYVSGVVVGKAQEIRDFDIVTRQRVAPQEVTELDVKTRAYAGWGSVIAGVLAFFLVLVTGDV